MFEKHGSVSLRRKSKIDLKLLKNRDNIYVNDKLNVKEVEIFDCK